MQSIYSFMCPRVRGVLNFFLKEILTNKDTNIVKKMSGNKKVYIFPYFSCTCTYGRMYVYGCYVPVDSSKKELQDYEKVASGISISPCTFGEVFLPS